MQAISKSCKSWMCTKGFLSKLAELEWTVNFSGGRENEGFTIQSLRLSWTHFALDSGIFDTSL